MSNAHWRNVWARDKAKRERVVSTGCVYIQLKHTEAGGRVHVTAPKNPEFDAFARTHNAKWRPRTNVWSFYAFHLGVIITACDSIWGSNRVVLRGCKRLGSTPANRKET